MTCDEARERIGADPDVASPELLAHLATCPQCQVYRKQMLALNVKIRRALELSLPPGERSTPAVAWPPNERISTHAANPPPNERAATHAANPPAGASNVTAFRRREQAAAPKRSLPRGLPIAASLAAGVLIALTLWLSRPSESLASGVITHVEGEPNSWSETQPVTAERLEAVLRKSRVKLGPGMQPVVYASSCYFRGHFVPHFVVMTAAGPVTVMILMHEHVSGAQQFNEAGYSGLLVPAHTGAVAVISRTPMALEQPASNVVRALEATKD